MTVAYQSCHYLSYGWVQNLSLLALVSVYVVQGNMICWEFDLSWDFFVSLSLIVWADEVNVCGCCLAGDMEC